MATDHRNIFCSWTWGISKKVLQINLYCLLKICVLQNLFPKCRPVYVTESARYCQQFCKSVSMKMFGQSEHDTKSCIMEWRHQEHVSRLCHPFPLPAPYSNNTSSFFKNSLWTLSLLVCLVTGKLLFCHPYVWASGQNPTCMHPQNNRFKDF